MRSIKIINKIPSLENGNKMLGVLLFYITKGEGSK